MSHGDETPPWRLTHVRGTAAELHGIDLGEIAAGERLIAVCETVRPALVLGSTQGEQDVDAEGAAALGVDIVRRRSGGGAVWLHPVDSAWVDLWLPRDDVLWTDDVSASMVFAGEAFVAALAGIVELSVRRDRFDPHSFGRQVCFASDAPGEVGGPRGKAVGISQRRDRRGARLQCVLYRRWAPSQWSALFVDEAVRDAVGSLAVTTVDVSASDLADRLQTALAHR